jgi:hypothetical protein
MKRRNSKNVKSHSELEETVDLPRDIILLMSRYVWNECVQLKQLLNWHSTCKFFWKQFLDFDDDKMLTFCAEKKKKNELLFESTFKSFYKNNLIEFAEYEAIITICKDIKKTMRERLTVEKVTNSNLSNDIMFHLSWTKWPRLKFAEDGTLAAHCVKVILKPLDFRLSNRYGWDLRFRAEAGVGSFVRTPFSVLLKKTFHCYLNEKETKCLFQD